MKTKIFFLYILLFAFFSNVKIVNSSKIQQKNEKQSSMLKKLIKYEFLYKKLTTESPPHFIENLPSKILLSAAIGLLASNLLRMTLDYKQPNSKPNETSGKIFLISSTTAYKIIDEISKMKNNYHKKIILNIIQNWEFYKFLIPSEFINQFDLIHNQYKANKNKLKINEKTSEEMIVAILLDILYSKNKIKEKLG